MTQVAKRQSDIRVNVIINLIRTLTMTILSFVTFPYVTRALGDQVFGMYTWANTFVYYFLVLAKISIPNIAIRECSKVKNDREALSTKAQEFFLIQAVTTLLSFGFECILVFSVPAIRESSQLIFLLSVNFLVGLFSFEWIYIALERHIYMTVRSITLTALVALMTYILIRPTTAGINEVYLYALLTISGTILTTAINLVVLPRYISFKKTQQYHFLPLLKPLVVLFFISILVTAYNQTDSFILGFLDNSKRSVGAYSVGVKGIDIVITLTTSLYTVFMPRATYYYGKEDKRFYRNLLRYSFNITLFIAIPAVATMATMADPICYLVAGSDANSYQFASIVLAVLASMMITFSLADNIYTQILLPQKKEKVYLFAMLTAVALNVGLSLLFGGLIFKDKPVIGVAVATMVSDVLLLAFLLIFARDYAVKATFNWNSLKLLGIGIAIGVLSYFLYPVLESAFSFQGSDPWVGKLLALIVTVLVDAVVYIVGLLLLRENLVSSFLPSSRRRREAAENEKY